jgi:hypothetical protein
MPQMPRRHVAAGAAGSLEALVSPVYLGLGGAGGVAGGAGIAVEEQVVAGGLRSTEGHRLRHGARATAPRKRSATSTGARQQSGAAALMPEQVRAGAGGVFAHPVVASNQQAAAAPAAEGGAADDEGRAEGRGLQPVNGGVRTRCGRSSRRAALAGAMGPPLPMAASRGPARNAAGPRGAVSAGSRGSWATTWRPSLSRPWRRISKRVERLMARHLQRASVVSQIGSSMPAAAGDCLRQRGRLPRGGGMQCQGICRVCINWQNLLPVIRDSYWTQKPRIERGDLSLIALLQVASLIDPPSNCWRSSRKQVRC